ncbi:hypothetical protein D9619_002722 [Psilocybe cf. subviscida]|uniref:Uncharacterized protein n=1 Tax=Psilocybe cf. subviscida TaxID=2480587 RepID=A0A8H5AWU5_9AGAR|nr:hypothetical protein D9619_002722 [Psilocybe cf. subviscida]
MATPPESSDFPPPMSPSGMAQADDAGDSEVPRKRSKNCYDVSFDDGWDLNDDGRPKTRRVNPQRLAVRLGQELVAEMEALIVPGAKMPNFTVRKDFQERYNVDRRHIYDYFHSRGLRVAKEDKHTNLIRGRAMKAQAQAQAQAAQLQTLASKPPPSPVKQEDASFSVKEEEPVSAEMPPLTWLSVPEAPAVAPKRRGRAPYAKRANKVQEKKPRVMRRQNTQISPKAAKVSRSPEFFAPRPLSESPSETLLATSSSGTDTDWDTSSTLPDLTYPSDFSDDTNEKTCDTLDYLNGADDFVAGSFDSPPGISWDSFTDIESELTCNMSMELNPTVDEHYLFTPEERTELYDLINNNIPRTRGLGLESSGTYNNFMDAKSRSYFDYMLPLHQLNPWKAAPQAYTPTAACDLPMAMDIPDMRAWLADDADLYQPAANH